MAMLWGHLVPSLSPQVHGDRAGEDFGVQVVLWLNCVPQMHMAKS